jgi:hypothetical protein
VRQYPVCTCEDCHWYIADMEEDDNRSRGACNLNDTFRLLVSDDRVACCDLMQESAWQAGHAKGMRDSTLDNYKP